MFADWPFTKFRRDDFHRLRILVSYAQSDVAATAADKYTSSAVTCTLMNTDIRSRYI